MEKKKVEPAGSHPGTDFAALSELAKTLRDQKSKDEKKETAAPVETPPSEVAEQPPRRRRTKKTPEETAERTDAELVKIMASEI